MPFIVLEGLDGAGKSTQLKNISELLRSRGADYEYLHFPRFDSPVYGELIARFLRGELGGIDEVDPYIVALLFAGDRADAAPMIKRWLSEGKFVVTDRFVYSNIAFQCAKYDDPTQRDALKQWILDLEFGYNRLPRPDVSVFLDVPLGFVADRLTAERGGDDRTYLNGAKDIHEESMELQRRVREVYLSCAAADPTMHVADCSDGNGRMDSPDNIFKKITAIINQIL
jgi:dTMP kinase